MIVKGVEMGKCKMGSVALEWPATVELWPVLQTHTWIVSGPMIQGLPSGSVYPDTGTFAWGDGGYGLQDGDILMHDVAGCTHE